MQRKQHFIGLSVAILAVVIAIGAFAFMVPHFNSTEAPASLKDESLTFVRDVVGMNLTEYQVVKFSFWPQDDIASPNGPLYLVRYDLRSASDEASVDIYYTKSNGTYLHESYFDMRSNEMFAPAYPGDKVLNWTTDFLERYTSYRNNATYMQDICRTFSTVTHLEPMNTTLGDMTFQITIKEFSEEDIYTTLQFRSVNQTAHDYYNAVTLEFHNGVWFNFADNTQQ